MLLPHPGVPMFQARAGHLHHHATSVFAIVAIPPFQALQVPVPVRLAFLISLLGRRDKPCEACARCTETGHAKVKSEVLLANGYNYTKATNIDNLYLALRCTLRA